MALARRSELGELGKVGRLSYVPQTKYKKNNSKESGTRIQEAAEELNTGHSRKASGGSNQ